MWDVSPYTLHEHSAFPSHRQLLRQLTHALCLFYQCLPRVPDVLLPSSCVLNRALGTITRNLFALIASIVAVVHSFHSSGGGTCVGVVCCHQCFTQKMDLGACPKSHTERLKTEFLAAKAANPNDPTFARFQKEYETNIFQFVDECDRRIRAAHRRLEKTPEENAKTTNLVSVVSRLRIQPCKELRSEDREWFSSSVWTTHFNCIQELS